MQDKNIDPAQGQQNMAFFRFLQECRVRYFHSPRLLLPAGQVLCVLPAEEASRRNGFLPPAAHSPLLRRRSGQHHGAGTRPPGRNARCSLKRLPVFRHLTFMGHQNGMSSPMLHPIDPINPSVAVPYNFAIVKKYTMYSCADGNLRPCQVRFTTGQVERNLGFMLAGNLLSHHPAESSAGSLADITGTMVPFATDTTDSHPREIKTAWEICSVPEPVESRTREYFGKRLGEHYCGYWLALLIPLYKKMAVTLDGLGDNLRRGSMEHLAICRRDSNETSELKAALLFEPLHRDNKPDDILVSLPLFSKTVLPQTVVPEPQNLPLRAFPGPKRPRGRLGRLNTPKSERNAFKTAFVVSQRGENLRFARWQISKDARPSEGRSGACPVPPILRTCNTLTRFTIVRRIDVHQKGSKLGGICRGWTASLRRGIGRL